MKVIYALKNVLYLQNQERVVIKIVVYLIIIKENVFVLQIKMIINVIKYVA